MTRLLPAKKRGPLEATDKNARARFGGFDEILTMTLVSVNVSSSCLISRVASCYGGEWQGFKTQ